jgi:hypothetical protein
MEAFLQTYGLWILLGGVFFAMHWFGMGCGGHRHGAPPEEERKPGDQTRKPASPGHSSGCH